MAQVLKSHSALPCFLVKAVKLKWQDERGGLRANVSARGRKTIGVLAPFALLSSIKHGNLVFNYRFLNTQMEALMLCANLQQKVEKKRAGMKASGEKLIYFWLFTSLSSRAYLICLPFRVTTSAFKLVFLLCSRNASTVSDSSPSHAL